MVLWRSQNKLKLKHLNLFGNNLLGVTTVTMAEAVVRLEECDLFSCSLTTDQLNGLFKSIQDAENAEKLKLRRLDPSENELLGVSSNILAGVVVKLENCDLSRCSLTTDQLNGLFKSIQDAENAEKLSCG